MSLLPGRQIIKNYELGDRNYDLDALIRKNDPQMQIEKVKFEVHNVILMCKVQNYGGSGEGGYRHDV